MCVIAIADKTRLTDDMVERMFNANNAGAGVAWREDGKVKWEKGLTVDEVKELCHEVPFPHIAHFRIPSCGSAIPQLCHPFPIEPAVGLALRGAFTGYVLFHNGHWAQWRTHVFEMARLFKEKIPPGAWSDTRGMAWAAHHYGPAVLEMLDEKCVILGPETDDLELYGTGWKRVNDVCVSNEGWNYTSVGREHSENYYYAGRGYQSRLCLTGNCRVARLQNSEFCVNHLPEGEKWKVPSDRKAGGTSEAGESFRNGPARVPDGETNAEAVTEGAAALRSGDTEAPGRETTALAVIPDEVKETFRWIRGLNPKCFRSSGGAEASERGRRLLDARNGILHMGLLA